MSRAEAASLLFDELVASLVERLVPVVTAAVAPAEQGSPWMNIKSAAAYLDTTEDALRSLVKRGEIPVHRTPNGRLLFEREGLDAWVRGETL